MELEQIIMLVTAIVTFILGIVSKKVPFVSNKLIPIQNLLVGMIAMLIYWAITKDFNVAIAGVGLLTGGTYDIFNNLSKLLKEEKSE